jgi:sigma-B regulation protein RsbU (phosphoserine phosphatase)
LKIKASLGVKITCFVVAANVIIAAVSIIIGYYVYAGDMDEHYKRLAENVAKTAATQMIGDKIPDYARTLTKDEDYERMLLDLFFIKESNDITFLYVEIISGDKAIYIMDADEGPTACQLGYTTPIAQRTYSYLDHLENGIPPFITHSDFGWLSSAYAPVFGSDGKVAALVGADISMNEIMNKRHSYLRHLLLIMAAIAILTIFVFLKLLRRLIVVPVNKLAAAAASFVSNGDRTTSGLAVSAMSELDIHTGDEIESLSLSMRTMARDIAEYVKNITAITSEKEHIRAELNVASRIQTSMLPCIFPPFPDRSEFDLYGLMNPAKEVGGDFYDFFMLGEDRLAIVIADVSGKGVPAALFMVISKTLIKEQIMTNDRVDEAFMEVNRQLCESNGEDMFVTVWAGVLEISTGLLTFANAGHNPPFVRRSDGYFEMVETRPLLALAAMPAIRYEQHQMSLSPGDVIYLYTDGVTEASNEQDLLYGDDRLKAILDKSGGVHPEELLKLVLGDVRGFVGSTPQSDDITMLGVRINTTNH